MKKETLIQLIIIIVLTIILTGLVFITVKEMNSRNNRIFEMMPMEENGQMQRPEGEIGEPPAKPEGDFRPEMPSNNI